MGRGHLRAVWTLALLGITAGGMIGSLVTAVIGAVVLLWIVGLVKKGK